MSKEKLCDNLMSMVENEKKMEITIHSWPRRSGKTRDAIKRCYDTGATLYINSRLILDPIAEDIEQLKKNNQVATFNNLIGDNLPVCDHLVVDDCFNIQELAILSPIISEGNYKSVHIYGTLGDYGDDYRREDDIERIYDKLSHFKQSFDNTTGRKYILGLFNV